MTNQQGAPEAPSYEHQRAIMEGERNASLDAYSRVVHLTQTESRIYEAAFTNGWNRLADLVEAQQPAPLAAAAIAGEIELIEKAVRRVGITSLLNHGAGSCVFTEGCEGVSQDHLLAYTREIALHCAVALGAHPAVDDMAKELDAARDSLQWYMRRCEQLQRVQHRMRDPERTMVCDILANGSLLAPEGQRYTAPQPSPTPQADSVTAPAGSHAMEITDYQVLAITTAYEQGVGKGRQAFAAVREISNPYSTGYRCDLAWSYGYEEGKEQAARMSADAPTPPAQAADSVLEDAARLKEAVGLLEELAEHDNYSTEYDGRMISLCPECGEQEGEHRPNCAFVRAKTFLAARKQGANHD